MTENIFNALFYNVVLLLAMSSIYTIFSFNLKKNNFLKEIMIGIIFGLIGIGIMINPFVLFDGVVFDTRSVLLVISGLFFGAVPTIIVVIFTSIYRLYLGGIAAYVGVSVIIASATIGILWRKIYLDDIVSKKIEYSYINLYILGLIVHICMLILMLPLGSLGIEVLKNITIPVITLYPIGTIFLGLLMRTQILRQHELLNLVEREEKYKTLVTEMKQGLAIFELIFNNSKIATNCKLLESNISFEKMIGIQTNENIGKTIQEILPNFQNVIQKNIEVIINSELTLQFEYFFKPLNKYFETTIYSIGNNRFVLMFLDITERSKREKEVKYLNFHDQLTGLYNRRFFEEELNRLDVERNLPLTIIMSDVNDLKIFNDAFGHKTGDALLKNIANNIKSASREDDIVSRIGGDEFVIILPGTDSTNAYQIIERINRNMKDMKVNDISTTISFGFATKNTKNENIMEIFNEAENNMYKNKLFERAERKGNIIDTIMSTFLLKNNREKEHSERVSNLCGKMGEALDFTKDKVNELKTIGLLHDIGKIALDESLLNKSGKLNQDEWKQMKTHPEIGYRILSSANDLTTIADYVLSHHERWDGKGYPNEMKEKEIPLISRIIALADSYDAMTCERTYKKVMTKEEAIEEILRNKGTQFDPGLVDIFINKVILEN